jgi:hypothetical protein
MADLAIGVLQSALSFARLDMPPHRVWRRLRPGYSEDTRTQLTLDLAGVSFIDLEGIAPFRALLNRRVALIRPSSFDAEQLRDLQP